MNRNEMICLMRAAGHHAKVFWKGLLRTAVGAMTAGMMVLAVYGYAAIPSEGGYAAVGEFMVATMVLMMAIACMYAMGGRGKRVRK